MSSDVPSTPLDAFWVHLQTLSDANGDALGWGLPVWKDRLYGNTPPSFDALGQPSDILHPQTVLYAPQSNVRDRYGDRWIRYLIKVHYYDFDYAVALQRADLIMGVYDQFKGQLDITSLFTIPATKTLPGWTAQLVGVQNLRCIGALNDEDPRLWITVVNLDFRNFTPIST